MSGEVLTGRADERRDVIAMLERRLRGCATMERRSPEEAERAGVMRHQLELLISEIGVGMHEGEADVAAMVAGGAGNDGQEGV